MTRDTPLIIDDVASACGHLTPLGASIIRPACETVRSAVREFAGSRGWTVVAHEAFSRWLQPMIGAEACALSLDPLLPGAVVGIRPVRVSRVLRDAEWSIEFADDRAVTELPHDPVCLIDDAVASGSTLKRACAMVHENGGSVSRVLVLASTSFGRSAILDSFPGVEWLQHASNGRFTIHLRDACPYAPFSGRPHANHPPVATACGDIPVRIPSITIKQSLWGQVFSDYRVLAAAVRARSEVSARLSGELGREATVADLPLLGADVALPAYPRHRLSADTSLASIC